jgi:hypothetical protein
MTKTNGLVNEIVCEAFLFFPIDAERYELCAHLEDFLRGSYESPQQVVFLITEQEINEYMHDVIGRVEDAVVSVLRNHRGHAPETPERARDMEGIMADLDFGTAPVECSSESTWEWIHLRMEIVLGMIANELRDPRIRTNIVPTGHGG